MMDRLNAFLDYEDVPVANAAEGSLSGLTLAVKDLYDVAGYPTGWGNPQKLAECPPVSVTAPSVQQLLDAGARFIGKTQTDELAFSLMGQNAHYPEPVNSAAPDRVTGGSSSGSAAAVAGGLADIAIGSDTGGSIRGPASFCGLIGLRTTHGRISLEGAMTMAPSLDTFGWFARDAATYDKVGAVLLGEDSHSFGRPRPLRLPVLDRLVSDDAVAREYSRIAAIAADVLGEAAEGSGFSLPTADLFRAFRNIQGYEVWAVHGDWISARDRGLGPGVKERFEYAATLSCEVANAETKNRRQFNAELAALLGDDGVLVLPTVPGAAPLRNASLDHLQDYRERAMQLLCLSSLSGFPQISIPIGEVDGAPFGLSLLGPANTDRRLIALAADILAASGKA